MRTATLLFQNRPHYRVDSFKRGLERAGFSVRHSANRADPESDVLIVWNRMNGRSDLVARHYEAQGKPVFVVENGYIGSDATGGKLFAMSLGHHLGKGHWRVGDRDRWRSHNIELRPWREAGDKVVLLPQRGIGEPGIAMPHGWQFDTRKRLSRVTDREIVIRNHPGANKHDPYEALDGAHCAVTWASGAAIKAVCYGVPIVHGLPGWIGEVASTHIDAAGNLEVLNMSDDARLAMIERLAWAQWSIAEIESGEAFGWLLECV